MCTVTFGIVNDTVDARGGIAVGRVGIGAGMQRGGRKNCSNNRDGNKGTPEVTATVSGESELFVPKR